MKLMQLRVNINSLFYRNVLLSEHSRSLTLLVTRATINVALVHNMIADILIQSIYYKHTFQITTS